MMGYFKRMNAEYFAAVGAALLAAFLAFAITPAVAQGVGGHVAVESAAHNRYIVVFRDGVENPRAAAAALARQHGFDVRMAYSAALKGFAANLSDRAVAALGRDRRVDFIEADQLAHANAQTSPTGVRRIFADGNPNITINGADDWRVDVGVAVIDSGVAQHPDINLAGKTDCTGSPRNQSCTDGAGDDGNGHGTHVAGTIGALDNGIGVVGVAPGARIWAVKVLKNNGSGWISNIIGGIDWVTAHPDISVANMSLGGGNSDALCAAVSGSVAAGVAHVVAAGNDNANAAGSSPANCNGAITVSALADFNGLPGGGAAATCRGDVDDTLADFSNWGGIVDIAAPGVCILSTWNDGGYNTISGTSMASPHVAGAAALLASNGNMSPADILGTLTGNGNADWIDDSGDGVKEPLLDVSDTVTFAPATIPGGGDGGPVNAPPAVAIEAPTDGSTYLSGELIMFSGSALDAEDGDLAGSVSWTSSIDGGIGLGGSFSVILSDGNHAITASVTDNDGAPASDSVTITVGSAPAGGAMYVGGIGMAKKGPNLNVAVTILEEGAGNPVSGATVNEVLLVHDKNGNGIFEDCSVDTCWNFSALTTDSNGRTKYKLLRAPGGNFQFQVNGLSHASLIWNPSLDVDNPQTYQ